MEVHLYDTHIHWIHDRKGLLSARDVDDRISVATPPQFPKGMAGIWSPEHLFAASVSSCLMTTFLAIAENSRLEFDSFSCKATAKLDKVEGKLMIAEVTLNPVVTIPNEKDRDKAERILHKSEKACLISNSIRSRIVMENVQVRVGELA
jgi:organic hydroperoxide reductase OsmC/OhrA